MSQSTVADLLTDKARQAESKRALFSISPDLAVAEAVSSMAKNEISSMIVMEADQMVVDHGVLVGILSFHDIARSAIKDVAFENQLLKQYIKNWPE